jgi:hypothetical protein
MSYAPLLTTWQRAPSQVEFGVAHVPWLEGRAARVNSQFGEDGYIRAIFERIGETNRWCLECGAGDGVELSPTLELRKHGWRSLLIEANAEKYGKIAPMKGQRTVNALVDSVSLGQIIRECECPEHMDFACIDVDGQDFSTPMASPTACRPWVAPGRPGVFRSAISARSAVMFWWRRRSAI